MKKIIFIAIISLILNIIYSQDQDVTTDNEIKKEKNGWDYFIEGKYNESIKALKKEKELYPQRINIYVIMGWNYKKIYNYNLLEQISLEGLKINPRDARIVLNLAEAYYFQKKYSKAVSIFKKYIAFKYNKKDIYIPIVYYYLGNCYYNLNSYRKADIALSTAKYYNPNNIKTVLLLANTKEKLKEYDKANNLFNTALKIQPYNTIALDGIKRLKNPQ